MWRRTIACGTCWRRIWMWSVLPLSYDLIVLPLMVSRSSTYIYYYIIVHIFSMNNSTSHSNKYLLESHLLYIHCITTHHYTCSQRSCSGALVHIRANITTLYGLCSGAIIQHRHSIYTYISQRSCSGALVHIQVI